MISIAIRQDLDATLVGLVREHPRHPGLPAVARIRTAVQLAGLALGGVGRVLGPGVVWARLARALPLAELLHGRRGAADQPAPGTRGLPGRRQASTMLLAAVLCLQGDSGAEAFSVKDIRSILTYDEMMTHLQRVATRSPDVTLSEAPYRAKATGRAIPVITVGYGPRKVFITAMQHGNEYRVSNAAVAIAEKLSRGSNAWMRSALTVVIMPRVNVDGFDRTLPTQPWRGLPWRQNVDPTAVGTGSTTYPFGRTGIGWDINRYHPVGLTENPYIPTAPNPVPEALAVRNVFDQVQPSIMLDMHEQPSIAGNVEGRPVDVAVAYTESLGVAPAVLAQEKRIAYATLLANPRKRTAYYSFGSAYPGMAQNRYGVMGVPSLLLEFRGLDCWIEANWQPDGGGYPAAEWCTGGGDPGNRSAERLATRTVFLTLKSIADGSVDQINPALADQYILRYQTTPFPTGTEDDH